MVDYFSNKSFARKGRKKKDHSSYLFDVIKKKVDLSEFLETEIGCTLEWTRENREAKLICPMPGHKEAKPSFHVALADDDDTWIYHCFGCGAKGTVIDFCMQYYDLSSASEAILFICEKFGFKQDVQLIAESIKDVKKKMNLNRKLECAHIVSANQCRFLLRKDYAKHSKWVNQAYRKMNKALDIEDIDAVESIGFEASARTRE